MVEVAVGAGAVAGRVTAPGVGIVVVCDVSTGEPGMAINTAMAMAKKISANTSHRHGQRFLGLVAIPYLSLPIPRPEVQPKEGRCLLRPWQPPAISRFTSLHASGGYFYYVSSRNYLTPSRRTA